MKKLLCVGLLALGVALVADQPAQAWVNHKFSVGMNWQWQSGGNRWLCGLFQGADVPGGEYGGEYPTSIPGPATASFPGFPTGFPWFGQAPPPGSVVPNANPTMPASAAKPPQATAYNPYAPIPAWQGQNYYQPASYSPAGYAPGGYAPGGYTPAGYTPYGFAVPGTGAYYPGYYGYSQPPSYWYGR